MIHRAWLWCVVVLLGWSGSIGAGESDLVELRTTHVRVMVPRSHVERVSPVVARAEPALVRMAADAGVTLDPARPLRVWLSDLSDLHNGFSTTIPAPLVQSDLALAHPASEIFAGHDALMRTLIHEFAHHLSNDPTPDPWRQRLQGIFGRVLPSDPLSIGFFMLTAPGHVTMPSFWHEGVAQWAETAYADPASPWGGRGRDPLVHMIWRLDAQAQAIPTVDDWTLDWQRWPYGSRAYHYGLAYTRWLAGQTPDNNLWRYVSAQQSRFPFAFNGGAVAVTGSDHLTLIARMRADLAAEQQQQIKRIRSATVTAVTRLTPVDWRWGAPVWLDDGRLLALGRGPLNRPGWWAVDRAGQLESLHRGGIGALRRASDGAIIGMELSFRWNGERRTSATIRRTDGRRIAVTAKRISDVDVRPQTATAAMGSWQCVGLRPDHDGRRRLVIATIDYDGGWNAEQELPTVDEPWSPCFRPQHTQVAWVETTAAGSRLILAELGDPRRRTVVAEVRGRILHPVFTSAGDSLYFCSDVSGVANAYHVKIAQPGMLIPVTNTIGGITACVPSPDGRELAVVEHDAHGPFLGIIAADPTTWPTRIPTVNLNWPAPGPASSANANSAVAIMQLNATPSAIVGGTESQLESATNSFAEPVIRPLPAATAAVMLAGPYRAFSELRPLFWTPTSVVVPEGGFGVVGYAADPLLVHTLGAGVGRGSDAGQPIGELTYAYSGSGWQIGVIARQAEQTYERQLIASDGAQRDYIDLTSGVELRVGAGVMRAGLGRPAFWRAYVAAGVDHFRPADPAAQADLTVIGPPPFTGNEAYVEAVIGFDTRQRYPTSYSGEDGYAIAASLRHSGLGGERDGWRARVDGAITFSLIPEWAHQLVVGAAVGTGETTSGTLQGRFTVGGSGEKALPRGYPFIVASGDQLLGGSLAYRLPLWRPFAGAGTSPWRLRQIVAEAFADGARISADHPGGDGTTVRSLGVEAHADFAFAFINLAPGLGVARQLDDQRDTIVYFTMDFRW